MDNNIKIIEFMGLPGSGKTTISANIQNELDELNIRYLTSNDFKNLQVRKNRSLYFLKLFMSLFINYKLVYRLLIYFISLRYYSKDNFKRIKAIYIRYFLELYLIRKAKKEKIKLIIYDEGIVHLLWCLLLNSRNINKKRLEDVLKHLNYKKVTFINTKIDKREAVNRVQGRINYNNSRFDKLSAINLHKTYNKIHPYYKSILHFLKKCNAKIIEINSSEEIVGNVKKVLDDIYLKHHSRV